MASPGAKRRAEDRASVEYLVEQYPEWFLEEGWDGEQSEKRRRQPTPDYSKSVWGKMLLDPALDDPTSIVAITFRRYVASAFRILFSSLLVPRSVFICWFGCVLGLLGTVLAACLLGSFGLAVEQIGRAHV